MQSSMFRLTIVLGILLLALSACSTAAATKQQVEVVCLRGIGYYKTANGSLSPVVVQKSDGTVTFGVCQQPGNTVPEKVVDKSKAAK